MFQNLYEQHQVEKKRNVKFSFIKFVPTRMLRDVEAAQVEVFENGTSEYLWMSLEDILNNIKLFGVCSALKEAARNYGHEVEL